MDINYHYFVIKTLASRAGFDADDAQTIAWYSQRVDDYSPREPVCVDRTPPAYFQEHGCARRIKGNLWIVEPHPTGINMVHALGKEYRHTTLAPFHFIPPVSFSELEKKEGFTRSDYRCVPGCMESAVLIRQIVKDAVTEVKRQKSERSLMELGMALHTYADTYAHCGYSGLEGWENKAEVKRAFSQRLGHEEIPEEGWEAFCELPPIGHGNAGIVPDITAYQIDVAFKATEEDDALSCHIRRDNLKWFLQCAREIMEILCAASGMKDWTDEKWETLSEQLARAMQVPTLDEMNKDALVPLWSRSFPDITYEYDKEQRFIFRDNLVKGSLEWRVSEVSEAFFDFNELAYRRTERVLG